MMMNFCKYSSALLLEQFLLYLNILLQVCALIKVLLAYARKRNMDLCMWSSLVVLCACKSLCTMSWHHIPRSTQKSLPGIQDSLWTLKRLH